MWQTLHIFQKDVRCLTYEIVVTLALVAYYVYSNATHPPWSADILSEVLLPIAGWVLIARLIHAEALPGTKQFWLTRPYSRMSLLAAKVLFLLIFVNLPKLVGDAIIVRTYGYSLSAMLPGLLWSQVLLFGAFVLPIAALAALTSSMTQLFFSSLFLFLVSMVGSGFEYGPMDWIPHSFTSAALVFAAAIIVLLQYTLRRTTLSRLYGLALWLVAIVGGGVLFPLSTIARLQARESRQQIDPSQVRIALDSERQSAMRVLDMGGPFAQIQMPLQVSEVSRNFDARIIGLSARIEAADGTVWPSHDYPETRFFAFGPPPAVSLSVPRSIYTRVKNQPVKLQGTAYVTLFGAPRTTVVGTQTTVIPGIGVCRLEPSSVPPMIECRGVFRPPSSVVHVPHSLGEFYQVSYSPFPAELGVGPVSIFEFFRVPLETPHPVALVTLKPLAYIQRDFEISNLRLRDYEKPPPTMRLGVR